MKKLRIVLAISLLVFGLAQCNLLTTTIEYEVTSTGSGSFHIYYTSDVSDLTEFTTDITAAASWTKSWTRLNNQETRLAFIQVTESTGDSFTVTIEVNGATVATDTKAAGDTVILSYIVE